MPFDQGSFDFVFLIILRFESILFWPASLQGPRTPQAPGSMIKSNVGIPRTWEKEAKGEVGEGGG